MKKYLFTCVISLLSLYSAAQNLPMADYKRLHFGFNLGLNILDFGIQNSLAAVDGKVYQAEVSNVMPGFSVGVFGDLRLCEYLNLRFVPTLHLGERTLSYMNNVDDEIHKLTLKASIVTFPIYLKYSAVRINNYRPYILVGGGAMVDFAHDQKKDVLLDYWDGFIDFGVGCTFYFEYFRFSPEIKFGMGFSNILTPWEKRKGYLDPEGQKYTDALSKLTTRIFTITFNFE